MKALVPTSASYFQSHQMSETEVCKLAAILQQAGVSIFHFVGKTIPG
jgi:hypothetical protein